MTPAAIIAVATMARALIVMGKATVSDIREALGHNNLTEEQMNAICDWVKDDASWRKAQADIDAGDVASSVLLADSTICPTCHRPL